MRGARQHAICANAHGDAQRVVDIGALPVDAWQRSKSLLGRAGGPLTADWSVNGQLLVADDLGGGPLRVILPNGEASEFDESTVPSIW